MWVVRILVVEDEVDLASAIARGLRQEGMAVDVALDGMTALDKASVTAYDVIVLDRDLPVLHGDDVCRQLVRTRSTARVLMLTASGGVRDRIEGLDLGADDYLPKPFAFGELVARIRAVSRRADAPATTVLTAGDVAVDPGRRVATRAGVRVDLSRNELAVLEVLVRADGAVVSAEELLERVWDEHIDPFTNTVRMTVMKLRRKLGDPPLIDTVTGEGYRIAP
jgi:DNA-binding response OmpR family regulator